MYKDMSILKIMTIYYIQSVLRNFILLCETGGHYFEVECTGGSAIKL